MTVTSDLYTVIPTVFPTQATPAPILDYLTQFCVEMANGEYFVRDCVTGEWATFRKTNSVINTLTAQHQGVQNFAGQMIVITREIVSEFVKREVPVLGNRVFAPGAPQFIRVGKHRCLNIYNDRQSIMEPAEELLADASLPLHAELILFLNMIRSSLCAKPLDVVTKSDGTTEPSYKSVVELLDIANGEAQNELEFRFLMSWLAAIFQSPGRNLQTNIWFSGDLKGIGKGTLSRVLRIIFGGFFGSANQTEVERGWTNWIEGHFIMEVDEFDDTGRLDWNKFIKRTTTNSMISLARRNFGSYDSINTCNWIFHDNTENPLPLLEQDDRRNFFIQTTGDRAWALRAAEFNRWVDANTNKARQLAAAFAAFLTFVEVDERLIATAPDTEIRVDNQMGARNAVEAWLEEDAAYPRDVPTPGVELFALYKTWQITNRERSAIVSDQQWGIQMAKFARKGRIKRDTGAGNKKTFTIPSSSFPVEGANSAPTATIIAMKNRFNQNYRQKS